MSPASHKRILLIIGGGIAAYKTLELIRRLREQGAAVSAIMTKNATNFITPLSVASLSGAKVYEDLFSLTDETEMGHIQLSRNADLLVIAPATANLIAKMAHGLADDLASTVVLATDKKILIAPAMNVRMWLNPATRRNIERLVEDGILIVGPEDGEMACGEFGPGRMSEPAAILKAIEEALLSDTSISLPSGQLDDNLLAGRRVLITSGPTFEPIDPIRYLSNRSSGRQGHAIARAAARAGAETILVSGPVGIADPPGVKTIHVETAQNMLQAVQAALPADIFIAAAAVADWRVAATTPEKIKKGQGGPPVLTLVENPDILATIAQGAENRPLLVIGFAAETENILEHAKQKLARKGCDLIIANDVSSLSGVMGGERNKVTLVSDSGSEFWPRMSKDEVAIRLVATFAGLLQEKLTRAG